VRVGNALSADLTSGSGFLKHEIQPSCLGVSLHFLISNPVPFTKKPIREEPEFFFRTTVAGGFDFLNRVHGQFQPIHRGLGWPEKELRMGGAL
jgi:hypothetical protein